MSPTTRAGARGASGISLPGSRESGEFFPSPPGATPDLSGTVDASVTTASFHSRVSSRRASFATQSAAGFFDSIPSLAAPVTRQPGIPIKSFLSPPRTLESHVSPSQPVVSLTRTQPTGFAAKTSVTSLFATESSLHSNQASSPSLMSNIDSTNSISSKLSAMSSSQPAVSQHTTTGEMTRQINIATPSPNQITWTMSSTLNKDINDPYIRKLVDLLQRNHPWAPAKLCHSMLVECRYLEDANDALQNFAFEASDEEDSIKRTKLRESSKAPSTPGAFSRAERQRAIASSTETLADRERASFVANAVLYKAFSYQEFNHGRIPNIFPLRSGFKNFSMTSEPFSPSTRKSVSPKHLYQGTTRGKFQPLSFNSPDDGRVVLQSVGIAFPYVKTSFEELRFGDYIRGRKKAPHLFDLFRKLPAEIRCMIWRFSMLPRTVELRYDYDKAWTVAKIPVTLSVSRESRYEALKRYTLSFGIGSKPAKVYFDFNRDTLFLTYEKWHGEADYNGEADSLVDQLVYNKEAQKVRALAMDRDLVEILAGVLESEEEEWYDDQDEDAPMPELMVIPAFTSLESLAIVKTTIDGFWEDHASICGCCSESETCEITRRSKKNDNAVFVSTYSYNVANKTQQEYYKQVIAQIKSQNKTWSVPELAYMFKRPSTPKGSKPPRTTCACGDCYPDSE